MTVAVFIACLTASVYVERSALRIAYGDVTRPRWQAVGVFLAGGLLSAVFAAVSTVLAAVADAYGLLAFFVMLGLDLRMLVVHESTKRDASTF